jgi:hypothetical protein
MRAIMRGRYCWPHIKGVPPDMPPFYVVGCLTCEAKLDAGKITGQEPPPETMIQWRNRMGGKARQRAIAQTKIWRAKLNVAEPI